MAAPHVTGAVALLLQSHPSWTPRAMRSARLDRGPRLGRHRAHARGAGRARGGGLVDVVRAPTTRSLHRARLALVRRPGRQPRWAVAGARGAARRRGRRRRNVVGRAPSAVRVGRRDDRARPAGDDRTRRRRPARGHRPRLRRCGRRRQLRLRRPAPRRCDSANPVLLRGHAPRARAPKPSQPLREFNAGDTRDGRLARQRLPLPRRGPSARRPTTATARR